MFSVPDGDEDVVLIVNVARLAATTRGALRREGSPSS
jgi:hypothetical protein